MADRDQTALPHRVLVVVVGFTRNTESPFAVESSHGA